MTFSSPASAGSITLIATLSSVWTLQPSNTSPMPPRARKRFTSKIWLRTSPTLMPTASLRGANPCVGWVGWAGGAGARAMKTVRSSPSGGGCLSLSSLMMAAR